MENDFEDLGNFQWRCNVCRTTVSGTRDNVMDHVRGRIHGNKKKALLSNRYPTQQQQQQQQPTGVYSQVASVPHTPLPSSQPQPAIYTSSSATPSHAYQTRHAPNSSYAPQTDYPPQACNRCQSVSCMCEAIDFWMSLPKDAAANGAPTATSSSSSAVAPAAAPPRATPAATAPPQDTPVHAPTRDPLAEATGNVTSLADVIHTLAARPGGLAPVGLPTEVHRKVRELFPHQSIPIPKADIHRELSVLLRGNSPSIRMRNGVYELVQSPAVHAPRAAATAKPPVSVDELASNALLRAVRASRKMGPGRVPRVDASVASVATGVPTLAKAAALASDGGTHASPSSPLARPRTTSSFGSSESVWLVPALEPSEHVPGGNVQDVRDVSHDGIERAEPEWDLSSLNLHAPGEGEDWEEDEEGDVAEDEEEETSDKGRPEVKEACSAPPESQAPVPAAPMSTASAAAVAPLSRRAIPSPPGGPSSDDPRSTIETRSGSRAAVTPIPSSQPTESPPPPYTRALSPSAVKQYLRELNHMPHPASTELKRAWRNAAEEAVRELKETPLKQLTAVCANADAVILMTALAQYTFPSGIPQLARRLVEGHARERDLKNELILCVLSRERDMLRRALSEHKRTVSYLCHCICRTLRRLGVYRAAAEEDEEDAAERSPADKRVLCLYVPDDDVHVIRCRVCGRECSVLEDALTHACPRNRVLRVGAVPKG